METWLYHGSAIRAKRQKNLSLNFSMHARIPNELHELLDVTWINKLLMGY